MPTDNYFDEMMKLAESIDTLAESIAKDAASEEQHIKTASRLAATDYGSVGDEVNLNASDSFTRFLLS